MIKKQDPELALEPECASHLSPKSSAQLKVPVVDVAGGRSAQERAAKTLEPVSRKTSIERRHPVWRSMGYECLAELERVLPQYAAAFVTEGLFSGEPDAAVNLAMAAPNDCRGMVAMAAYYLGTPNPGFRELLSSVWSHDSGYLQDAADCDHGLVRRMFRAARFECRLSTATRVYRGVADIDAKTAGKGLSWTTSRDVACWFAMREAYGGRRPLVMTAVVDPADVIFFSDERSEKEVILRRVPRAQIDAERLSWKAAASRYELDKQTARARSLAD